MRRGQPVRFAFLVVAIGCAGGGTRHASPQADDPRCRAQVCHSDDGGCDAIVVEGFRWNGGVCEPASDSGCGAVGPDCAAIFETLAACRAQYATC